MTLPQGVPGFPECRDFILLDHQPVSLFRWLQSLDLPELAFVVIDPVRVVPDYPVERVRGLLAALGFTAADEAELLAICTFPAKPAEPTVNLMAPIAISPSTRLGAQLILHDASFGARETFLDRVAA